MDPLPTLVTEAKQRAEEEGFPYSCNDDVGRVLATLAASVPPGGRVLELGTGTGVGTAWLCHGVGARPDVAILTVEIDQERAARAQSAGWPPQVRVECGDAVALLPDLGTFDLVFADAQGGKWERLDLTLAAVRPGGVLVVDDMTPQDDWSDDLRAKQAAVAETIAADPAFVVTSLDWAGGVVLAARRRHGS